MNASRRFTGKADAYSKYRPNYPESYIDHLISYNNLTAGQTIADIGSGTGILTKQLLDRQLNVLAVEPNVEMRSIAEQSLSSYAHFISINGTAEYTGLTTNSIDLITVAQAFHWFDKPKFRTECQRILKPYAQVALVWNSRDSASPLVKNNAEICQRFCPDFKGFSGGIDRSPNIYKDFFHNGRFEYKQFRFDLSFDLEGFVGRNLSASYAPKPSDIKYRPFVGALEELFSHYSNDGVLVMPNLTRSYIGRV